MTTFLVAIAIGVVIGLVLGALGGGGGVLTVPALVYLISEPTHQAATASLVIVGVAALVGIPAHARSGNVRWAAGALFGGVGTVAAVLGTIVSRHIDADVLLLAFAVLITVSAVLMIRDARRSAAPAAADAEHHTLAYSGAPAPGSEPAPPSDVDEVPPASSGRGVRRMASIAAGGAAVGLMTGLFGVGGGFLAVPLLVLVMQWPITVAVGTSLLVIVINSAAALAPRLATETLDWAVIGPVTAAAVIGVVLGKLVTDRVSGPRLSGAFAVLLVLVAVYTATHSVIDLAL